jgi:serine/threonine protein phosphatase PrpC
MIAIDGYCGQCGMKQPAPEDHHELDLGEVAAVTDRGLHHHRNEDAFAIAQVGEAGGGARVVVVCDGVSSTADSHLAARAAAIAACGRLQQVTSTDPASLRQLMTDAIAAAQLAASAIPDKGGERPSSTIVATIAVVADDANALVVTGWLGDSRAYWMHDDVLHQISEDDSWATDQINNGMPANAAYSDPTSHTITRWLGADAIDVVPHIEIITVPDMSTLILCSDGLWNYAPSEQALTDQIDACPKPHSNVELARSLTNFARDAGGHDNITVAIASL